MNLWWTFWWTSPFRNRVAKLRGPSEGLGGNAANVWSTQLQAVQQWNAMSKGGEVDRWKYVAILICRQCWLFLTDFLAICGYNCCKVRAIWGNLEQFWAILGNFMQSNFMQFGAISTNFYQFLPISAIFWVQACNFLNLFKIFMTQFEAIWGNFLQFRVIWGNFGQFHAIWGNFEGLQFR